MKLVSVECNNCGAPLEVSEMTRFLTCGHCHSRLAVHDTGSARFTEKLDKVAENLEVIRLQNELERLDREWLMQKEKFMVSGENGVRTNPSPVGAVIALVVGGAFLLFWIGVALTIGAPAIFPLFGLVALGVLVVGVIVNISKASDMESARSKYESRRRQLLARLDASR